MRRPEPTSIPLRTFPVLLYEQREEKSFEARQVQTGRVPTIPHTLLECRQESK